MSEPDRYPVEGRPFEPYCRFEVCLADEPHMEWCPQFVAEVAEEQTEEIA